MIPEISQNPERPSTVLVLYEEYDGNIEVATYIVQHSYKLETYSEVRSKMEDAIRDWLLTEEGQEDVRYSNGYFNWGDAMTWVPDSHWEHYGIYGIREMKPIAVEHNHNFAGAV